MIALDASTIVVGFGGNVGGDAAMRVRFARAREALAQLGDVRSAALYLTSPIGPPQPAYLNSAVRVRVSDAIPTPRELVDTLHELERMLGRERDREVRWGPRTIDLDVLLWGQHPIALRELTVPHPRLVERRFALQPAAEVVGEDVEVPGTGKTLAELLAAAPVCEQDLAVIASSW